MAESKPRTFQEIIEKIGPRAEIAQDMGVGVMAVHQWFHRNTIPATYDRRVLARAAKCGVKLDALDLLNVRSPEGCLHGSCASQKPVSADQPIQALEESSTCGCETDEGAAA